MKSECVCSVPYPPSLLLGAVGVTVQAGEDSARRHQLAGLVPAVCVAQPSSVALTLLIQDRVQSANQTEGVTAQKRPPFLRLISVYRKTELCENK